MRCFLHTSACVLLGLLAATCQAADSNPALFSTDGYRITQYRSPTPATAEHAQTLDTAALQQLLKTQPATRLVDVYRRTWLNGQFIEDEPHANLPGSVWLANTGNGDLDGPWQAYFSDNLQRLSEGDQQRPLVFYCRADCWASWNAIKRAYALGYKHLYWYRDGIDAWGQAGLPLLPAQPQAFP